MKTGSCDTQELQSGKRTLLVPYISVFQLSLSSRLFSSHFPVIQMQDCRCDLYFQMADWASGWLGRGREVIPVTPVLVIQFPTVERLLYHFTGYCV